MYSDKFYYEDGSFKLIDNDTFKTLKKFENKTFKHSTKTILWTRKDLPKVNINLVMV